MNFYLISDTHFNHTKIATYCERPEDFTARMVRNWCALVKPEDCVIHLGDVFIGPVEGWKAIGPYLPGRKILVRGNHDRNRSLSWWMRNGFDFACDGMFFRNCWLSHEPDPEYRGGLNLHGHWHNIWDGFLPEGTHFKFLNHQPWNRLFAVEYTNYMPIEFDKFVARPEKYKSQKPND